MTLNQVKDIMISGSYTCVLTDGEQIFTSTMRGVRPLVQFLKSGEILPGCLASDKVVGKATAYLYILLGIRQLYAQVISEPAAEILKKAGISVQYEKLVPNIINRTGDGICPFEMAVMQIQEPEQAYSAILTQMREMNIPTT